MRALPSKLKPASGFSHFIHLALVLLLPAMLYVLVRINFVQLAIALVILSKWRMFAVRPRYWLANIRANAIDIMVGLSIVAFMAQTDAAIWQLFWVVLYGVWLIGIKPRSGTLWVSFQALIGQGLALTSLFLAWKDIPQLALVPIAGLVAYLAARHYFTSYDEPHAPLYAYTWGYFSAALMWVVGHWLLFYGVLAQPTLLLSVIGLIWGVLYYLEETDRLSILLRRQLVFIMIAVIVVIVVFSDWGSKTL